MFFAPGQGAPADGPPLVVDQTLGLRGDNHAGILSLFEKGFFFHLLPFLAIVKDILIIEGIGVMVLMMITSKPLPGLPTVGSPPLPLVTHNLAILDGPARFHLHRHHHDGWL